MTRIHEAIRDNYEKLAPAHQRLADYLSENYHLGAFMTAQELATATDLSEAAVIRFAQAVGFSGFPGLRSALRQEVLGRLGAPGILGEPNGRQTDVDTVERVFQTDKDLVEAATRMNDVKVYERLARRLIQARRIWVTGHNTSQPLAEYMSIVLHDTLGNAKLLVMGTPDLHEEIRAVTNEDVVIGISFFRYFRHTIDILRVVREQGASVAAITDGFSSPASRLADEVLLAPIDGTAYNTSLLGVLSVINAVLAAAAREGGDRTRDLRKRSEETIRRLNLVEGDNG